MNKLYMVYHYNDGYIEAMEMVDQELNEVFHRYTVEPQGWTERWCDGYMITCAGSKESAIFAMRTRWAAG